MVTPGKPKRKEGARRSQDKRSCSRSCKLARRLMSSGTSLQIADITPSALEILLVEKYVKNRQQQEIHQTKLSIVAPFNFSQDIPLGGAC